jgi:hypothetical protein
VKISGVLPTMTSTSQSSDATQMEGGGRRTTAPAKDHHEAGVPDTAFTIGARVLVGGQKPGRLRYIGSVHFVPDSAGLWCGIELDDPDGLHDGTVDGVRYFTCRDGHGILAPRHRVMVHHQPPASASMRNPWSEVAPPVGPAGLVQQRQRNMTGIPSPVQLRRKKIEDTGQPTSSSNAFGVASLTDASTTSVSCTLNPDVRRSIPEFRVRPNHSPTPFSGVFGTTATGSFGGGIAGGGGRQIRPMSASMIDSDVVMRIGPHREQMTYSSIGALTSPKRSNLIGNRPLSAVVQIANVRSSPKRVTFFDEVDLRPRTDPAVDAASLQRSADRHGSSAGRKPEADYRSTTMKKPSTAVENPVSLSPVKRSQSADGRETVQTMTSRTRDHHRSSRSGDEVAMSNQQTKRMTASPEILTVDEYEIALNTTKLKPIPGRNTPSSDTEQQIDTAIADMLTPPDTEMQISADSIDLSDQLSSPSSTNTARRQRTLSASLSAADHRKLSLDSTLAEFYSNFPTDARPSSRAAKNGSRASDGTRSASDERRQSEVTAVSSMSSWSSSLDHDCGGSRSAAGLELARTALAQYADLVRAAQQCRLGFAASSQATSRRSYQPHQHPVSTSVDLLPPAGSDSDMSIGGTASPARVAKSFDASDEPMLLPHHQLSSSQKTRRSPAEATWESWNSSGGGSSCTGGGEDMEFETFDGEELLLDAAMIDSIDGASVHSEDSMAMVPHLSDDDDDVDDIAAVSFPEVPEIVDVDDDRLRSSVYEIDSLNVSVDLDVGWPSLSSDVPLDRGDVTVHQAEKSSLDKEGNVTIGSLPATADSTAVKTGNDIGWLNDINDVISRQLRQPWTLMVTADVESGDKHDDQPRPMTANDDVMYDSYGRIIRPMSLISNSSSIDTGE